MKREVVGWSVGLIATSALAGALLVSAFRPPPPAAPGPVPERDPATLTDLERELILNRIREGDLRALQGDLDGARAAWREARARGAGLWAIHEGLGDSLVRAKLLDEAIVEYRIAEPLVPERLAAMQQAIVVKRAEALAAAGRPLEALEGYLEANRPRPLAGKILDEALKAPDGKAAAELISRRAEVYDPRVFPLLAAYHEKRGAKAESAEALARYAIRVAPWEEDLDRQAIEGLRAAGKFDLAIEVCRAWARAVPQSAEPWERMGDLHLEAGREKEAIVAYSSIVDLRPGDAAAHRRLGSVFLRLGRTDAAIAQYEAAKKARPEDPGTWATLASLYGRKEDEAKVEETVREAIRRFGSAGEMGAKLVEIHRKRLARARSEGKVDDIRALRRKLADLNVPDEGLYDLKIVMTWDVWSDVDLDVHEPDGEHVQHMHTRSKSGGRYYVDNTRGRGPETYTLAKAAPGTYRVGAHLHGGVRSTVTIAVILHEDTPREERREETFVLEKDQDRKFIRDVVIP